MENLNNLPPFYVGQKVVCIRSHSLGIILEGQEFTVTSIFKGCCLWRVTVGVSSKYKNYSCGICNYINKATGSQFEFGHILFAPRQESPFPSLTMKEVIEKEKVLTCLN